MQTAIATAETLFKVKFFRQDNKSGFVIIEVEVFNEWLLHVVIPVPAVCYPNRVAA